MLGLCSALGGAAERPRDPWVFRCVLDQRPRMVVLALHESLWAAYDATTCSLYKAWKGDVKFQGAVYDTVHGPQPVVRGDVLLSDERGEVWNVTQTGQPLDVKTIWRGYRLENNQVILLYELRTEQVGSIGVEERVDVEQVTTETALLVRTISTRSVPPDTRVTLTIPCAQLNDRPVPVVVDNTRLNAEPGARATTVSLKSNAATAVATIVRFTPKGATSDTEGKGADQ
jgi:cytochrome c